MADTDYASPAPTPPPKKLPFLRMLAVARDNVLATIPRPAYELPVFDVSTLLGRGYVVSDPGAIQRVLLDHVDNYPKAPDECEVFDTAFGSGLLSNDGEVWRTHRRIMAPAFHPRQIQAYVDLMLQVTQDFLNDHRLEDPDGLEADAAMTALALKMISRTMFSAEHEHLGQRIHETVTAWQDILARITMLDFAPVVGRRRAAKRRRAIRTLFDGLEHEMAHLIRDRRSHPGPGDLLDLLVQGRDPETGRTLSDSEVMSELITIFIAGHETTAVAMTWALYLLARHPQVQDRLATEVQALEAVTPRRAAELASLTYAGMVVDEAARIFPAVPRLPARIARSADVLCGVAIPAGARVIIAPWIIHRHQTLWTDPERFDPERFRPGAATLPRFAHMPYGGGRRTCIGAALATAQARIMLGEIVSRYRLSHVPTEPVALRPQITLRPKSPIKLRFTPRPPRSPAFRDGALDGVQTAAE